MYADVWYLPLHWHVWNVTPATWPIMPGCAISRSIGGDSECGHHHLPIVLLNAHFSPHLCDTYTDMTTTSPTSRATIKSLPTAIERLQHRKIGIITDEVTNYSPRVPYSPAHFLITSADRYTYHRPATRTTAPFEPVHRPLSASPPSLGFSNNSRWLRSSRYNLNRNFLWHTKIHHCTMVITTRIYFCVDLT